MTVNHMECRILAGDIFTGTFSSRSDEDKIEAGVNTNRWDTEVWLVILHTPCPCVKSRVTDGDIALKLLFPANFRVTCSRSEPLS